MPRIQLGTEELAHRENRIRQMLNPLTLHPSSPACRVHSQIGGAVLFGAYDGSYRGGPARDWRFATVAGRIYANYYERWIPIPGRRDILCLTQAYLTIYQKEGPTDEEELLALHCDPEEPDGEGSIYKRGPHLHISIAGPPIRDAHIALARGHLDHVLANAPSLMEALTWSIVMIRDEILKRC
jgi:hypothetical protein